MDEAESSGSRRPELPSTMDQKSSHIQTARPQETFSIATPVVTNISQMEDSFNDGTFLHSASSYNHLSGQYLGTQQFIAPVDTSHRSKEAHDDTRDQITTKLEVANEVAINQVNGNQSTTHQEEPQTQADLSKDTQLGPSSGDSTKKKKGARKAAKLDTKSKLEKSRQSARECRARKKLRYQYLEDLVCNREKAVVKLREELSMFCEMSKRIDDGTLSDKDRHLLIEQTKENSKS